MNVTAFNPGTQTLERTFLQFPYAAGTTSIVTNNNSQVQNGSRLLIGEMGLSQSEIVTARTPAADGETVPISATLYSHSANDPVYVLQFDEVQFYRSTTGSNGPFTLLTTVAMNVANKDLQTTYNDVSAQSGYYYEIAFLNSSTLVESALSDPIPALLGWNVSQVGYVIQQVMQEVDDTNEEFVTRDEYLGYFNDVNEDLQMQVAKPYSFLRTRQVYGRTAAGTTIPYPTDSSGNQLMWKHDRLDYNYVDDTTNPVTNQTYTLKEYPLDYFRNLYTDNTNDTNTQDDQAQTYALDETQNEFVYYPPSSTSSTAVFYHYYWGYFTRITTEGQNFQTPTGRIYKFYAKWRYYEKRAVTEPNFQAQANNYQNDYQNELIRYKQHDRKSVGTPRRFVKENRITRGMWR